MIRGTLWSLLALLVAASPIAAQDLDCTGRACGVAIEESDELAQGCGSHTPLDPDDPCTVQDEIEAIRGRPIEEYPTGSITPGECLVTDGLGGVSLSTCAAGSAHGDGANCSAGSAPLGVDGNGAVQGCFDVATQSELDAAVSSPRVVTVCSGGGCDATVICDTDCTTKSNSTCVGGSGIALAEALSPTQSSPVLVTVHPGSYDECAAINDMTDTTLHILPGAVVRPTVTAYNDVDGGVIRVGNDTTTNGANRVKVIVDGHVQNDAFSGPEAGIQVGEEDCSGNAPRWGRVDLEVNGTVVGQHDGIQWCGDGREGPSTTDLPKLYVSGSGTVISGRDPVTHKGNSIDEWQGVRVKGITNYCESSNASLIGTVTGTAQAGSGAGALVIEAADDHTSTDGAYAGRVVTFGGGGCAIDGQTSIIRSYDTDTNTATFDSPGGTASTSCTYSIAAVSDEYSGCRDIDWNVIAASNPGQTMSWKLTGVHFGISGPATASALDSFTMKDTRIEIRAHEAVLQNAVCSGQSQIAGILSYQTIGYGTATFEDVDIDMHVDANQGDTSCALPISGIAVSAASELDVVYRGGTIRIFNTAEPDLDVTVVNASSSDGRRITIADAQVHLSNTVAGYAGDANHLLAQNTSTIEVSGQISAPFGELLEIEGVDDIDGWTPICSTYPNGSGDGAWNSITGTGGAAVVGDQQWFPFAQPGQGFNLYGLACASRGPGTNGAIYSAVQDTGGGTIVSSVACDIDQGPLTWRSIPAAQVDFAANEQLRWFLGTESNGSADDMLFCIRATTNRWAN